MNQFIEIISNAAVATFYKTKFATLLNAYTDVTSKHKPTLTHEPSGYLNQI